MKNSSSRNIAGIVLIVLGAFWLLSYQGLFDFDFWEYFWPALFLAIGVGLAVRGKALFLATIFIFFGSINLAAHMFRISYDYLFHNYWPLILIALGLLMIFRRRDGRFDRRWEHRHGDDRSFCNPFYSDGTESRTGTNNTTEANTGTPAGSAGDANSGDKSGENTGAPQSDENADNKHTYIHNEKFKFYSDQNSAFYSDKKNTFYKDKNHTYYNGNPEFASGTEATLDIDRIDEVAILTSIRKYIISKNFKGGEVKTILGGGIIDFSGAKLAEGENVIELTSIMGGVTFRVPQDWKVVVNVHSIFGGFEDKRRYFSSTEPHGNSVLIIKGTVIMGGGTVTY